MITLVDYGLGNIMAFANIYKKLNITAKIASTPEELDDAERIILPGVGAFDWAMNRLNDSGLRQALDKKVLNQGTPVIGICVGMQIMARRSDEGVLEGLGWVDGEVKRFDDSNINQKMHLPHMGWNDVAPNTENGLFKELQTDARFYFLHSYYFEPDSPDSVLATTDYGGSYASSVGNKNVYGVQFHPEKSHQWGIQLLKNFAEI
jgi:glutamine amidotransferase